MSGFFKKIFGSFSGGDAARKASGPPKSETYNDHQITAEPIQDGAQWRLAGTISREVDGEQLERTFVRADLFASREEAETFALRKAQQIIDQSGPSLFADRKPKGRA